MKKVFVVVGDRYSNVTLEGEDLRISYTKDNVLVVMDKKREEIAAFKFWQYWKKIE